MPVEQLQLYEGLDVKRNMGSSLEQGPFWGPFYKGAVLYWGPTKGPYFRELPI